MEPSILRRIDENLRIVEENGNGFTVLICFLNLLFR